MKLKQLIMPIIVGLFIASMAGAITLSAPFQGGTGQDSSSWTGVIRTDGGVWSTTTPAGGGDITDVFDCSTGDCNTMTVGTSEYLTYGTGYIDANRFAGVTTVDGTEFGYLNGLTAAIVQTGSASHDGFSDFVANEHINWTADQGTTNIHAGNYTDTTIDGCNDCLNDTEIEDIYLHDGASDVMTGTLTVDGVTITGDSGGVDDASVPMTLYNTDATPPAASGFPIGTIYIQYTP